MRGNTHKTWIAFVRDAVDTWRKREGWSQATVVQVIVETHVRIGADDRTGLKFEPSSDPFDRMRINSERVYRWLDEGKDNNLLGVPFLESILAALPQDLRLYCVSEMLGRHCGLVVRIPVTSDSTFAPIELLRGMIKESGEAQAALVCLVDGATDDELASARNELSESVAAAQAALTSVEREIEARRTNHA